jgi:TPR repeat protein
MRPGAYLAIFRRLAFVFSLAPLVALMLVAPAMAEKRVALVIGNSAYRNVSKLVNPANDARLVASTLRDLGFTLVGGGAQIDLDKAQFEAAVQTFGDKAQGADVGLFYYAGHGVQLRGKNFLAPVEANLAKEADVYLQMVDAEAVLSQMEGSGARLNLVVLDACRNNPFGGGNLRAIGGGLAQMEAPQGTLISYATQPGNVAQDGADGDSPYTKALVQTVRRPGMGLFDVFNEIGLSVKRATGGAQQPWVASSPIEGGFYFTGKTTGAETTAALDSGKYEGLESPDRPDPALDKAAALSLHVAMAALSTARDSQAPPADAQQGAATPVSADQKAAVAPEAPLDPQAAIGACDRFASIRLSPIRPADVATAEFDRADAARAAAACRVALSAQPGKPRLMFALGRALMRTGGDEAEAVGLFQSAAAAGYAGAMNSLGWAYANGAGVARDPAEAVRWWRKGADIGNTDAMSRLAFAYERGVGVERDVAAAMTWWRNAAEAGDAFAMNRLGLAYANGFGFPKNPLEALAWFKKAAGGGETRAMVNVGMAYANGAGVAKDVVEAARWYRMAADAGNPGGMNHLGYVYEQGLGVPKDPAEAVRWYQKAADAGNVYAMNNLGLAYRNGIGVARNEEEAERWLRKARE